MDGTQPEADETVTKDTVIVRRSPRYVRFMVVGAVVFVIVAFILTFAFPQQADYDPAQVFGYLLLVGIAVGVALGALVALLFDRLASRRARTVIADRVDVRATPGETAGPAEIETSDTHDPTQS